MSLIENKHRKHLKLAVEACLTAPFYRKNTWDIFSFYNLRVAKGNTAFDAKVSKTIMPPKQSMANPVFGIIQILQYSRRIQNHDLSSH
ncbi:MAG: hypothetical protein NVS1B13_17170 [Flavisolibacter sp.]